MNNRFVSYFLGLSCAVEDAAKYKIIYVFNANAYDLGISCHDFVLNRNDIVMNCVIEI